MELTRLQRNCTIQAAGQSAVHTKQEIDWFCVEKRVKSVTDDGGMAR